MLGLVFLEVRFGCVCIGVEGFGFGVLILGL